MPTVQSSHCDLSSACPSCRSPTELGPVHSGPSLTSCPLRILDPRPSAQVKVSVRGSSYGEPPSSSASSFWPLACLALGRWGSTGQGMYLVCFLPCCLQGNWHLVGVLLANACYTDLYEKIYHFVFLSLMLHSLRTPPGPPPIGKGHIPQGEPG